MDNIKQFKVNGTAYGLNLSEIGAVINDGGTPKELKQYIDSHSGGGGGGTSSKVVLIDRDWYQNTDNYQSEIKKAFEDIYNEVTNNRSVTVIYNGDGYYTQTAPFVSSNIIIVDVNFVEVTILGWDKDLTYINLTYDEGSNYYRCSIGGDRLTSKNDLMLTSVYSDGRIDIDVNNGRISEFINDVTVENEDFVVVKTTVPAYSGTGHPNEQIYTAIGYEGSPYYLSKFAGMKLKQMGDDANYDLIPDGQWYVLFNDIGAATYRRIIVTKSVKNDDGSLDVYLGFKGINLDTVDFSDCTVENHINQGDPGRFDEKNWINVPDIQKISVESFLAIRTRYFCVNTDNVKVDRIVLFKRMK